MDIIFDVGKLDRVRFERKTKFQIVKLCRQRVIRRVDVMANKWAPWKILSLTNVTYKTSVTKCQQLLLLPCVLSIGKSSLYSHDSMLYKFFVVVVSFLVKRMSLGFCFLFSLLCSCPPQTPGWTSNGPCHFVRHSNRVLDWCWSFVFPIGQELNISVREFLFCCLLYSKNELGSRDI